MKKKLKIFMGYSGSKGFAQEAEARGHEVVTCDAEPKYEPDWIKDMLEIDVEMLVEGFDVIQLSPMCTSMTLASGNTHWDAEHNPRTLTAVVGRAHLNWCLKVLDACTQMGKLCFIENPNGRGVWFLPDKYRVMVTYCSYGDTRMKLTNWWHNCYEWNPRVKCKNNNPDCDHERAPRGSKTGTQGLKNSFERSRIPKELCLEIIEAAEKHFT